MDIFLLKACADELARRLPGSRISKVFQLSPEELLLRLWRGRVEQLLLSVHPDGQRLQLTTDRFEAPPRPPRFAALLRARLRGARLQGVAVRPYERVVTLTWQPAGEGAPVLRLIHELQGAQANVILVDERGLVVDALRHQPAATHANRPVLPGTAYAPRPVPAHRVLLPALTADHLVRLQANNEWSAAGLNRLVVGLSPLVAAELVQRYPDDAAACWKQLDALRRDYDDGTLPLFLCTAPHGQQQVSVMPLRHAGYVAQPLDDAAQAMAAMSKPVLAATALEASRAGLSRTLRRRLQKLGRKTAHLVRDRERLESYEPYQRYGTLLLAQRLPRGSESATVTDYYSTDQETIRIPLDPRLSLQDNAQAYFKKHRKTRTGTAKIAALLEDCAAEDRYLGGLLHQVETADDWDTLRAIESELEDSGRKASGPPRPSIRPRAPAALPYRELRLPGGYTLYSGKSNHGNDALVRQVARPDDLWFHARGLAGSHVVLKGPGQGEVPHDLLLAAAAMAAFYSKGRDAAGVEVIYAAARHVRKFGGARPGQVRVQRFRTLEVAPALPEVDVDVPDEAMP